MTDIDLTEAIDAATSAMLDEGHNGLDCRPDHSLDVSVEEALRAALPAIREQLAQQIKELPTNRTKTWTSGFDSVAVSAVLDIVRGGEDRG